MKEHTVFSQETQAGFDRFAGIIRSLLETGLAHSLLLFEKRDEQGYTKGERRAIKEMDNHKFAGQAVTEPSLG